jgi:signal transduction histidine kinase
MNTRPIGSTEPEINMPGLYQAMSEASPVPVAAVAGVGNIIRYVNPAFCVLARQSAGELLGRSFNEAIPAGHDCLAVLDRVYQTAQAETHTGGGDGSAQSLYWSYAIWPAVTADGENLGIVIQVTESRAGHEQAAALNQALLIGSVRQHELAERAEALNVQLHAEIVDRKRAEEELQRTNQDLEKFTYAVTHDLTEPLRTVTAYTQMLARRLGAKCDPEEQKFIDYILAGSRRMGALIKDLLLHAQLGNAAAGDKTQVDCTEAVQEALLHLKGSIQESHAVITVDRLPLVEGDLSQLVQLFQNLIGNALKYRKPDFAPEIHLSAARLDGWWRISVKDNGIGFKQEYAEQIFGVFKRLHGSQYSGTGIGLAICKRIVERWGGSIGAVSEGGLGATFFFNLREASVEQRSDGRSIGRRREALAQLPELRPAPS